MFLFWRGKEWNAIEFNPNTVGLKNTVGPPEVGKNPSREPLEVEDPPAASRDSHGLDSISDYELYGIVIDGQEVY